MAKVDDYGMTILPLEYFRRYVTDIDPYHFWQMRKNDHPIRGYSHIYPHERWMYTTDVISQPAKSAKRGPGRLDMLQAIARAESAIANVSELNTWPGPMYTAAEEVILDAPSPFSVSYPTRQLPYGLRTKWWRVQSVGVQTYTPVQAGVSLSYDATDDVTLTVTTTVVASELAICYPGTEVQIRPIEVSKSGNTATITLKKWLCGDPDDWEMADPIEADTTTNLLATVDVYRVWVDPSDQITLAWEPNAGACNCNNPSTCQVCTLGTRAACAFRKDYKFGYVGWQYADWNASTSSYDNVTVSCSRFPNKAYINYMHGFPANGDRYISRKWAHIVSILSAAMLPDYVYDATSQPQQLYYWREDFTKQEGKSKHNISQSALNNPFGTKRGGVEAWLAVCEAIGE